MNFIKGTLLVFTLVHVLILSPCVFLQGTPAPVAITVLIVPASYSNDAVTMLRCRSGVLS